MTLEGYVTAQEAARVLRCTVETVRRMCARGELAAVKVGQQWIIPRDAVAWYARNHVIRRGPKPGTARRDRDRIAREAQQERRLRARRKS